MNLKDSEGQQSFTRKDESTLSENSMSLTLICVEYAYSTIKDLGVQHFNSKSTPF